MSKTEDWNIWDNPEDDDSEHDESQMKEAYQTWLKNNERVKGMTNVERAEHIKERRRQLAESRIEACRYVENVWEQIRFDDDDAEDCIHKTDLHDAIWHASTEILPAYEVQAVIDSKNDIYVSTGTSGYVDYLTIDPSTLIGMKLPIRCWIHTHPFGQAYFSGTDWRTINIWGQRMNCAYVLGSEMSTKGHYGYWDIANKNDLHIYENGEHTTTQVKWKGSEEE